MSEFDQTPLFTFKTRTNTELGAQSASVANDGSIIFHNVLKMVTESMLSSYPRAQLGTWTPNRLALRFDRDEIAAREPKDISTKASLDLDDLLSFPN